MFGFASSNGSQRGRKWEAHSLNHSMGGEGKEGGERAVRLLPGKGRRALPHPPVPSPSQPPPRELSRERRAPTPPLPLRSPGPQRSGHLGSGGPRPASAGWPPGRSRPVHPVGGCGQWQSAPSCLAGCQRSGRKLASTLGCQGPALRDGIASRVLPTVSAQMKGCGVYLLSM